MSNEIELLSRAEQMLATVARADEAAKLADMAEAARVYARKADLGTAAVNHATIIKARALKRMAELVDAGQARGEIASRDMNLRRGPDVPRQDIGEPPATLSDLGITRQRLHEARKLEPLPDATMVEIAEEANDRGEEVSVSRLVKAAQSDRLSVHYSSESPEWYTPPEMNVHPFRRPREESYPSEASAVALSRPILSGLSLKWRTGSPSRPGFSSQESR